ncbi:hypothetical protein ACUW6O_001091 [Staphylococcus epidermidis]|nr:Uncharacterised protein [Staphylococcus epidermidis]
MTIEEFINSINRVKEMIFEKDNEKTTEIK